MHETVSAVADILPEFVETNDLQRTARVVVVRKAHHFEKLLTWSD